MIHPVLPGKRDTVAVRPAVACALVAVLTGAFLAGCGGVPVGEVPPPPDPSSLRVDRHLDTTPPRTETGLELTRMGWRYNCMECHRHLKARWHHDRPLVEHRDLRLEHGANRFCLNCHHPENRNAFVDYDGSEIPQEDVTLLCGKCHGPTYRDWLAGLHGRRNGFWLTSAGDQSRLRCIQCHDPHRPAFRKLSPLAPPTYPERAAGRLAVHHDGSAAPTFPGKEHGDEH